MGFLVKITTKRLTKNKCKNLAEEYFGKHVYKTEPKNLDIAGKISFLFENSEHAKQFVKTVERIELN
jgi:hypothetical protein